jgi:hypothetical protein
MTEVRVCDSGMANAELLFEGGFELGTARPTTATSNVYR